MAQVLRLATKTQEDSFDFLTGTLRPQNMTRMPNGDGWYTTSMMLVGRGSDSDILYAADYLDNNMANTCDLFWSDTHQTKSVWLEESATSETTKRSLVKSIELQPVQDGWFSPLLNKKGAFYQLTIIHSAVWEGVAEKNFSGENTNCLGGTILVAAPNGSMSGRVEYAAIFGDANSTTDISTLWGGIRPHDTTASDTDFNPVLELENANRNTGVTVASDSDYASPNGTTDNVLSYVSTSDDYKMCWITLDDAFASVNYDHWYGDYQVLLRCKLSAANSTRFHVDWGYKYGTYFNSGQLVYVSSTDYQLYEMGNVSIPPFPRTYSTGLGKYFEFQVYALSMGSAATITLDCLILIPSKHYFKITNAILENSGFSSVTGYISEDNLTRCENVNSSSLVNMAAQFAPNNFSVPVAGGIFVIAAQAPAIHYVTDEVYPMIYYYERYRTHAE